MVGEKTLKHVASGQSNSRDKDIKTTPTRSPEPTRMWGQNKVKTITSGTFNWHKLQEANPIVIVNCLYPFRPAAARKCLSL